MASEDPSIRNRKLLSTTVAASTPTDAALTKRKVHDDEVSSGISFLDILRVLSGILVLSCVTSWFVTDGDSLTWNYKSGALRWNNVKMMFRTPLNFSDTELMRYNGEDPNLPIYVAVNGSVFDVSSNLVTYGPGGGYSFFAGRDAARAYVSGCFVEDLTWDLRGLEEQFIEGAEREEDDTELEEIERLTATHKNEGRVRYLMKRRERRRIEAWQKVVKAVNHWDKFFRNHDKYFYVGTVTHPDLSGEPIRPQCKGQGEVAREESVGARGMSFENR